MKKKKEFTLTEILWGMGLCLGGLLGMILLLFLVDKVNETTYGVLLGVCMFSVLIGQGLLPHR